MVDNDRDHDEMLRRALLGGMLGDHAPPSRLCGRWWRFPETVARGYADISLTFR